MMLGLKDQWWKLFEESVRSPLYHRITRDFGPATDWMDYSEEKVDDFIKALLASVALLEGYQPFSTVETGVFAGGTSAVFLRVLPRDVKGKVIHVGIDPYFTPDQSYGNADVHGYNARTYLRALRDLSRIADERSIPYVPYLMGSNTFIGYDLLPSGYDFRIFHLDGEHTRDAVFQELTYFSAKANGPSVFILDDIGPAFPGVLEAVEQFQNLHGRLFELGRFSYSLDQSSDELGFAVYYH